MMLIHGSFYTWSRSLKIKNKLLALDIFRLIRPFSKVQLDTEDRDYGLQILYNGGGGIFNHLLKMSGGVIRSGRIMSIQIIIGRTIGIN